MLRLTPSDPAAIIAGDSANAEQVAQIRYPTRPRPADADSSSSIWSGRVLTGDFGESFFFKKTVASLIGERIEPTLSLAFFTILIAVVRGGPARRDGGALARQLARSPRDGILGARIFGAGVRHRLSPDLRVLDLAELAARCRAISAFPKASAAGPQRLMLPSVTLSVIYVALIARHDPHQRAGSALGGLHPYRPRQGDRPSERCCSAMR